MLAETLFIFVAIPAVLSLTMSSSVRRNMISRLQHRYIPRRSLVALCLVFAVIALLLVVMIASGKMSDGLVPLVMLNVVVTAMVGTLMIALTDQVSVESSETAKVILAIGAHPDDLELACGGTIARLSARGHHVHTLVMSRGGVGGVAHRREREAEIGSEIMGAETVTIHDFPDTNLELTGREMITAIEAAIGRVQPSILLTHSPNDTHQDHQAVHWATMRAARGHHSILCFESPSATAAFSPSVFFDVEAYIAIKVAGVESHRDQTRGGKQYMTGERLRGIATFRGGQARRRMAEGFEVVRLMPDEVGMI